MLDKLYRIDTVSSSYRYHIGHRINIVSMLYQCNIQYISHGPGGEEGQKEGREGRREGGKKEGKKDWKE